MKLLYAICLYALCCQSCEGPESIQGRMTYGEVYVEDGIPYKITWWGSDSVKRYDYAHYVDMRDSCIAYKPITYEDIFLHQFISPRKKRKWVRKLNYVRDSVFDLTTRCGSNFILDKIDQPDPRIKRD